MPLILLKTEKNVIYGILHRKSMLLHEKVVFYKMSLNVQKSKKNGYFVQFQRKKMCIVFIFLFLIKSLESIENY